MTNERDSKNNAGLVTSHAGALSRVGAASLASRGMQDLLARDDAEQWLNRGSKFLAQHKCEKAVGCFERGLQLDPNHARIQCYLALAYYKGLGVPQDYAQAAIWWRRAAEQGNVLAQCELAGTYDTGLGVPQDYVQAAIWWRRAAEQGTHSRSTSSALLTTEPWACRRTTRRRQSGGAGPPSRVTQSRNTVSALLTILGTGYRRTMFRRQPGGAGPLSRETKMHFKPLTTWSTEDKAMNGRWEEFSAEWLGTPIC